AAIDRPPGAPARLIARARWTQATRPARPGARSAGRLAGLASAPRQALRARPRRPGHRSSGACPRRTSGLLYVPIAIQLTFLPNAVAAIGVQSLAAVAFQDFSRMCPAAGAPDWFPTTAWTNRV